MSFLSDVLVRNYREGDEHLWLHVVNESLSDCPGYEPRVLSDFWRWKSRGHFDGEGLFFAELGEKIIGTIAATPLKHLFEKKGRITDLAVLPAHQKKGCGSALLKGGLGYLNSQGVEEAEAWSWNTPAFLNFYEKHGFNPVRRYLTIYWELTKPLPKLTVNDEVDVRESTPEDVEALAELASKAYLPYWNWWYEDYGGAERVRAHWRKRAKDELAKGHAHFIARTAGRPVGFSAAQIDKELIEEKEARLGTLWGGVAVLPEYRRMHIGSRLLEEALTYLKKNGMKNAMVGTFSYLKSDTPAVNLYLKSGGTVKREIIGMRKAL